MANLHWMFPANTDTTWLALFSWFWGISFSVSVWQLAMCNWHLLLCSVPVNLFSTFGTGSSTKNAVPANIFILNCTLYAKLFKLLCCTCGRAKVFAKFQLKSHEDVVEIFESFIKLHMVSHWLYPYPTFTIGLPYPNYKTLIWWYSSHSAGLLYPFHLLWSRKTWIFWTFLYHHQLFCRAMVWRSITQQHFSFLLTLFCRCKISDKCSSSPFKNCTKNLFVLGFKKFRWYLLMSQLLQYCDLEANLLN